MLLVAGDLFHRQPLLRELREVDYLLSGLSATQVVMIAGNHDYIKKGSYYQTFSWSANVHMITESKISKVELPELDTAVYGLSYHSREIKENLYDDAWPDGKERYQILLAHGGDEKHIPFRKNILSALGYDYIALGHIHKPQELVDCRMVYAGALEPVDKNDTGPHGYVKGNLTETGCRTVFVPCALREYVHMDVEVSKETTGFALRSMLNKQVEERGIQNIYKINLTGYRDPDIEFDLSQMDLYGNILEIEDKTRLAYDFEKLREVNKDNLLGKYIESFADCGPDSMEYQALCVGVQALLETKRG